MKLSVIVPSLAGDVPPSLLRAVADHADVEIVTVTGERPVGRARNIGLDRATGEYIAWVDSDDEVTENWLPEIMKAIDAGPDVLVFDADRIGWKWPGDLVWGRSGGEVRPANLLKDVYENDIIQSHLFRIVTRRKLWQDLRFDEIFRVCEDYLLLPHVLARATGVVYIPKKLYRYICKATGLSSYPDVGKVSDDIRVAIRRYDETPAEYRRPSEIGSVWSIYYALEALYVSPAYRCKGERRDADVEKSGRAFLSRHGLGAARSIHEMARIVTAALGIWILQRLIHWWRFERKGRA